MAKRNPILHIKLSDLEKCFEQLNMKSENAMLIFEQAHKSKFQLRNNYFVKVNSKTKKKVERTLEVKVDNINKFNGILVSILQQRQLKNLAIVYTGGKNYILLKEIVQIADKYCIDFNFKAIEDAYKTFIEMAMDIMGRKYKFEKIKYYVPKIYDITECLVIVNNDVHKEGTKQFYNLWKEIGCKYSTTPLDIISNEDYVHFVYGRVEADEQEANYINWITAQFEELTFLNSLPELSQLYGINAKKRYMRYMANKNIKKVQTGSMLDPNREFKTEEEKAYFELLHSRKKARESDI